MKWSVLVVFGICIMSTMFCSCSKPVMPVEWTYGEGEIEVRIKADHRLNEKKGKAYTLFFVIYQLSSPDKFNQMGEDEEGLSVLLESKVFDPSVKSVKSLIIYPNSDVTYKIDRSQNAEYVGVVAGYNILAKDRIQRLYRVDQEEGKVRGEKRMIPKKLLINLYLSPTQIEEL